MLILFTSDLHGSTTLYGQLGDLIAAERPDVVLLGGDLLGDGPEPAPIAGQLIQLQDQLIPCIKDWQADRPGLQVGCLPGNHDWAVTATALTHFEVDETLRVLDLQKPWELDGVRIVGFPFTPWTPHFVKDFERLDEDGDPTPADGGVISIRADQPPQAVTAREHFSRHPSIEDLFGRAGHVESPWIFVCHAPPHATLLDRHAAVPEPIGSRAVRRFIEQRQPTVALHGHIHDSPDVTGHFYDQLGATLCINPGQRIDGPLAAVLFDPAAPAKSLRHTILQPSPRE
jgi:Icc-related predicted phosphoesterase